MAEEKESPPAGVRPIWIQMKNYDKYGLREQGAEAGNMTMLNLFVVLERAHLLDEVGKYGFMCDWNDFKTDLEGCPIEEILLVRDLEKKYGEQCFFTYTAEAFETQMALLKAEEEAEKARLAEEAEAARLEEEEADCKLVYEDKPFIPRPWDSTTAEETTQEVESLTIKSERPLVTMTMTRPRRSFGLPCNLADRDAYDWLTDDYMAKIGIRKYIASGFTAYDPANPDRKLMDLACQVAAKSCCAASQTTWFRRVNASVQYSTMHYEPEEVSRVMASEGMFAFLRKVAPGVEQSLQHNETVDIFQDAFTVTCDDDGPTLKLTENENELKELRTFTDLVHSKNKVMAAIDWLPKRNGCVAVSAVKNFNFDERVQLSGQVDSSYVLVWDFADLIHPMLKLETPHEIFCFRFNPTMPGIVVGGAINGQAVVWDITKSLSIIDQKKRKQSVRHIGKHGGGSGAGDDDELVASLPPIKPMAISHIDMSHRRLVADLAWLPPTTQVNSKGQLLGDEHINEKTSQFMTVASDGQCLIWDIRYQEISEGLLPHIAKPRQSCDKKREEHGRPPPAPWTPLFRLQLNRLEDVGELSLCRIVLDLGVAGDGVTIEGDKHDGSDEEVDIRSQLVCTTEEGEILLADWRARVGAAGRDDDGGAGGGANISAAGAGGGSDEGGDAAPEFVKWVSSDHTRPCVALDKSPFFPGVLLSVGDWSFQIWKVGLRKPVFSSPMASNYLTTGRWSPTRPGMLFLGKVDGSMDVWDFTDSSFAPSVTLMSSPSRITSMEFLKPRGIGYTKLKQQLLTVGDAAGNLHVYDVPQNLWRPLINERNVMSNFLEREMKRVEYASERLELRVAEAEALEAEELQNALNQPFEGVGLGVDGGGGGGAEPGGPTASGNGVRLDEGSEKSGQGSGGGKGGRASKVQEVVDPVLEAEMLEAEKAYQELESSLIENMNLGEDDLPAWHLATKRAAAGEDADVSALKA